jgi:hypothetical protein
MSENNEEKRKWGLKQETKENIKLRFSLIRITLLTLILYATFTSVYPLSEWVMTSTLDQKWKVYINQMIPILVISITAIATAFLAPIKQVREKVASTPPPSSVVPSTTVPTAPAPTPVPITPTTPT